jgi:hypothetical protein
MSSAATGNTEGEVSEAKRQQRAVRAAMKKKRDQRRNEIQAKIEKAENEEKSKLEKELNQMDVDQENEDRDQEMPDVKTEPTDAAASLASIPTGTGAEEGGGTSNANHTRPGDKNIVQSIEGAGSKGSTHSPLDLVEDDPLELDKNGEPMLTRGKILENPDRSRAGVPIESVARRTRIIRRAKVDDGFINMYGPKYYARYTIDESCYLKEGRSVEDLPEVSNASKRRIDKQVDDVADRVTATQFVDISAVAWQYPRGVSKAKRLELLDPVKVKLIDQYPTMKARQQALRDGVKMEKYPLSYVKVLWNDGHEATWEIGSKVRGLFNRNPKEIEERIYHAACRGEERFEKWVNQNLPDVQRSPTPNTSPIKNETPAPDATQPSQPQGARTGGQPTAGKTSEATRPPQGGSPSPEPAAAASTNSEMQAFALKYKEARGIDPGQKLSGSQKADFLMEYQAYQALSKQFADVEI